MSKRSLKKWRNEHRLTLAEFAKLVGSNTATVFRWERCKTTPKPEAIDAINKLIKKEGKIKYEVFDAVEFFE